jgi:AcrR family transcriptional regulator
VPRTTAAHEAERRQHVLAAARRAFVATGLHEASIDDVVAESGVSVGAIHNYCGGRTS